MYIVHRNRVILNKHFIVAYLLCAQNLSLLILLNTLLYKKHTSYIACAKKCILQTTGTSENLKEREKNLIFFSPQSTVPLNIEFALILAIFWSQENKKGNNYIKLLCMFVKGAFCESLKI